MKWTDEHKVFTIEIFLSTANSITRLVRNFRKRFNLKTHDAVPCVRRWVTKFQSGYRTKSAQSMPKKVMPRKVRTPEKIKEIKEENPPMPQKKVGGTPFDARSRLEEQGFGRLLTFFGLNPGCSGL